MQFFIKNNGFVFTCTNRTIYHILQFIQGGKVSQLQNSTEIRSKTFAVGPPQVLSRVAKPFVIGPLSIGDYKRHPVAIDSTGIYSPYGLATQDYLKRLALIAST